MKKPLPIIAAITLYTLAEILLLMSITVPIPLNTASDVYKAIVSFSQLVFIPGMAAVLSLCFLGRRGWWPRTWRILIIGAFGAALPVGVLATVAGLYTWTHNLGWDSLNSTSLFWGCILILYYGALAFVLRLARKMPRRTREAVAEHWLSERDFGLTSPQRKRRNRAISLSLWIPSISVLLVFLFFTEVWGTTSHLTQPRPRVAGYQLSTPVSWFVLTDQQLYDGASVVYGMGGRGPARGFEYYRHVYIPIFYWEVQVAPARQIGQQEAPNEAPGSVVIGRREIRAADENISCAEYQHGGRSWLHFFGNPTVVDVRCLGSNRVTASFFGDPSGLKDFYKMIGQIQRAD